MSSFYSHFVDGYFLGFFSFVVLCELLYVSNACKNAYQCLLLLVCPSLFSYHSIFNPFYFLLEMHGGHVNNNISRTSSKSITTNMHV